MSVEFDLSGRAFVVTGASSGIGAEVARHFGRAGAGLALVGRNADRLEAVRQEVADGRGGAEVLAVDLAEDGVPEQVVRAAVQRFGRMDGLVHSAGVFWPKPFADTSVEDLDRQWAVNARAPFLLTQAALPHLEKSSSVTFISSMMGGVGGTMCSAYCVTKGAVEGLTRALAAELAERSIRFNCIAPGAIETPMNEGFREDPAFYEEFRDFAPAKRWGRVEDIAPAAVFLATEEADFFHGARLAIDGGWVAR